MTFDSLESEFVVPTQPLDIPNLYTLDGAAERLACSPKTVRRMIADGKLKAVRVGRLIRIHPRDLERALKPVTTYGGAA